MIELRKPPRRQKEIPWVPILVALGILITVGVGVGTLVATAIHLGPQCLIYHCVIVKH